MIVLCILLGIVCIFDYTGGKIPNLFPILIALWGATRSLWNGGFIGVGIYVMVTTVVLFVLYPIFRIGGLGAGDVKLLSVCAGFFDLSGIFSFLFVSLLISAIFSLIPLIKDRNLRERISYFCEYCMAVARSGRWYLYMPQGTKGLMRGVCMSGPVLCSVLLGLGGLY